MTMAVLTAIDRAALPAALLPLVKQQTRVEFDRDDDFLKELTAQAIDLFERLTDTAVFKQTWTMAPAIADAATPGAWPCPNFPATAVAATEGGVDASSNYSITPPALSGQWHPQFVIRKPDAPAPAGEIALTITCGYADLTALVPGVTNVILRATAWLYENREAANMSGLDNVPYMNSLVTAYWRPRC